MAVRINAGYTLGSTVLTATVKITEVTGGLDFQIVCDGNGIQYDNAAGGGLTVHTAITHFCHEGLSAVLTAYYDFPTLLGSAITSASGAHGNGNTYTVDYITSAGAHQYKYSITTGGATFELVFSGTTGQRLANLLGMPTTSTTASTHRSTVRPYYSVIPYLDDKSKVSGDYEQPNLIQGAIAADGVHYSTHPTSLPTLYDFVMEFEMDPGATLGADGTAVFTTDVNTACPWSWQHFFQHCRASEPFLCVDDTESIVHFLRPDAAHFAPTRRQTDWDKFDIPLKTYLRGRL